MFWVLSVACMGIIFYFSSQIADDSTGQSNFVIELIKKILFWADPTSFIVRKSAHFLEYTGLCLMLNCSLLFSKGKKMIPWAILISSIYGATDEVHQIFVEGRSCQATDWLVDTAGALAGAIIFLAIFCILDILFEKRRIKK